MLEKINKPDIEIVELKSDGKYGKFIACSTYPKCKYIEESAEAKAADRINLRGFTDSTVIDEDNKRIALARALALNTRDLTAALHASAKTTASAAPTAAAATSASSTASVQ